MKVLLFQAHVENPIELTPSMVFITTPKTHYYFIIAINIRQLHGNIFLKLGRKNTIQKLNMTFSERYQIVSGGLKSLCHISCNRMQ
jgi:hypothetical protein